MAKRIVFVTGHRFGMRALEGIVSSEPYLAGALEVTLTIGLDPRHAAHTVGYADPAVLAAEHGIRHTGTTDGTLRSLAGTIASAAPDFLAVIGWSRLVHPEILALPVGTAQNRGPAHGSFSSIGMHPTQLPRGRGQAPIPWTIIKGLKRTALTVFFLAPTADSGPVVAQYPLDVRPDETAASLFHRFAHLHFRAGTDLAHHLSAATVVAHAQDDALATVWPRRRPADGLLHQRMTRAELTRTVRALLGPYPRAHIERDGNLVPVTGVFPLEKSDHRSAEKQSGVHLFACSDGAILLALQE